MSGEFFDSLLNEKTDCIFFIVGKDDYDIKNKLDVKIKSSFQEKDEILLSYFKQKYNIFEENEIINIYQGSQLLIGIIIKNEYRLCDLMFDISNSEKQSILSNFTWEGQYQVMVSKKNNNIEIYQEGNEIQNIINIDDGSYINLLCMYNIDKLNSTFYLFQSSVIIKPQYWNERLSIDLLFKYNIIRGGKGNNNYNNGDHNEDTEDCYFSASTRNKSDLINYTDYFIIEKEETLEVYSFTWSKSIIINVPLSISNFYIQENSSIIYIEVVSRSESSEKIIIHDIYSHYYKLNNTQIKLPVILENNQYFGFSLICTNDKKKKIGSNSASNNNNGNTSNSSIIPLFIKWRLNGDNSSFRCILTQFTIQNNANSDNRNILTTNTPYFEKDCKVNKEIDGSNLSKDDDQQGLALSENSNFTAICTFDTISKYPGETVYLNIIIIPNINTSCLNLEVSVEYNKTSPIIPLYDKMPVNYVCNSFENSVNAYCNRDQYNDNLTLLYPIKICFPGIYECPKITILDSVTKHKYIIDKYPLIVCRSNNNNNGMQIR